METKFIVLSGLFVLGYMGFIKFMWGAMQTNGLLDVITGGKWQCAMDALYKRGSMLEKVFGGCEQCTSWWWVLPYMPLYVFGMQLFTQWPLGAAGSAVWLLLFWFIASLAGFFTLTYNQK